MANTNSNVYANLIASPATMNDVGQYGGRVRRIADAFELAAVDFDADGDTITLCRLRGNVRIKSIMLSHDAMDSGATVLLNCGLYNTDGSIISETTYASAVNVQAAGKNVEIVNEARNIDETGNAIWQDAGATSDLGVFYDVVLTVTAANAGAQAGTIAFELEYTVD